MNKKGFIILLVLIVMLYYAYDTNATPALSTGKSDMGTVGSGNKNPLNIKKGGKTDWKGTIGYDQYGHAKFSSFEYGIRASLVDIKGKIGRGVNTINKLVRVWAEANTGNYSNFIVKQTKLNPNAVLKFDKKTMSLLVNAMGIWESRYYITATQFDNAWKMV